MAQLSSVCLAHIKLCVLISVPNMHGMMVHSCEPITRGVKAVLCRIQVDSWLYKMFCGSLVFRNKKEIEKGRERRGRKDAVGVEDEGREGRKRNYTSRSGSEAVVHCRFCRNRNVPCEVV